jgi:hypothetical protein
LTLLLAFALLWIAYFTGGVLFVPKIMQIFNHSDSNGQPNTSIQASSSSASGYVFMSIAALSTVPVLQGYLAALTKHVSQVQNKIAQLKKHGAKGETGGAGSSFTSPVRTTPGNSYVAEETGKGGESTAVVSRAIISTSQAAGYRGKDEEVKAAVFPMVVARQRSWTEEQEVQDGDNAANYVRSSRASGSLSFEAGMTRSPVLLHRTSPSSRS